MIEPPKWYVDCGLVELVTDPEGVEMLQPTAKRRPFSMAVDLWRRRRDPASPLKDLPPFIAIDKADELLIGDEPERSHCERDLRKFIGDSELALDWLRRWIEAKKATEPIPVATQTSIVSPEDKNLIIAGMEKRFREAYLAAKHAEECCNRTLTDAEAFKWLEDHGCEGYKLPMQDTFADYLSKARKQTGEQRKTPRANRTSRSLVRQSEL
jgi:hypothetical protein